MKMTIGSSEKSALKSVIIKPISLFVGIVYTPMLLDYLGNEKYGVWATVLSVISWINYCDIGLGNGLRNVLTKLLTEKQFDRAQKAISTAYICLTVIASIVFGLLLLSVWLVRWERVFNTSIDIDATLLISFAFICVNFVLALCNTLLYSLQKAEIVSVQSVVIQIINLVGVCLLNQISESNIVYMAILFGASTMVTYLFTSVHLFSENWYMRPTWNKFDKKMLGEINQLGVKFFVAQIAFVVLYATDNILVSSYFGAAQVTPFSIVDKVFSMGYGVFAAGMVPYWSKTTQELTNRNYKTIKKYFRNLNLLAIFFCIGCIGVAIVFRPIVNVWLGKSVGFSKELIVTMCIYYCISSFCAVSSPILNGLNCVNGVMVLGILQGVVNIPLSIYFATVGGFGIVGIRLATLILVGIGAIYQALYFEITIFRLERKDLQKRSMIF